MVAVRRDCVQLHWVRHDLVSEVSMLFMLAAFVFTLTIALLVGVEA